jgi:tetratricopeptide (TPR) repeat protein
MRAGYSRSLDPFVTKRFSRHYSNQSYRCSCLSSFLSPIACCLSIGLCGLFSQGLSAQTSAAATLSPTPYTVSASELRVPPKVWSHLESAHKEFGRGNLEKAEREVERALQLDPACSPAFSMRAVIRLAEKNPSAALADAARATSIDAYDGDAFVALAMAYNSLKDFENARKAASEALALQPDSWQARLEMAKSLYGQGQFNSALAVLNDQAKDFPDVHLVRGNVLMNLARRYEAVVEFTLFLQEAPLDPRSEQVRRICATVAAATAVESVSAPR